MFEAMKKEIEVHSSRNYWTLMRQSDLPPRAKAIIAIWSCERKCCQIERYSNTKLGYAHVEVSKFGRITVGKVVYQ